MTESTPSRSPGRPVRAGLVTRMLNQCRKPSGWLGRLNLWNMNARHAALTDWGLQQISIGFHDVVLDVGCGGGRTIAKLSAAAGAGKVYGIDFSETSVAMSRRTNRASIAAGRVEIRQASVSSLPFADATFDLVTAVETHYFWPDLLADVSEIRRVLKPGGKLVIIAEAYRGGRHDEMLARLSAVMKDMPYTVLTVDEHRALLGRAGYDDVSVVEEYDRGWVCAIGRRPSGAAEPTR